MLQTQHYKAVYMTAEEEDLLGVNCFSQIFHEAAGEVQVECNFLESKASLCGDCVMVPCDPARKTKVCTDLAQAGEGGYPQYEAQAQQQRGRMREPGMSEGHRAVHVR